MLAPPHGPPTYLPTYPPSFPLHERPPTGAGAAPADPRAGPALRGQLRPGQGDPGVCLGAARPAVGAEERPGGGQSLQRGDERARQVIQRSLNASNPLALKRKNPTPSK